MEPQRASIFSFLSSQTWENDYCIILKHPICKLNKKHMWIRLKKNYIYQWKILWANELWSCGPFWNLSKSLYGSGTWRWCGVWQWEKSYWWNYFWGFAAEDADLFLCSFSNSMRENIYRSVGSDGMVESIQCSTRPALLWDVNFLPLWSQFHHKSQSLGKVLFVTIQTWKGRCSLKCKT